MKWWSFVTTQRETYDAAKEKFFATRNQDEHDSYVVKSDWKKIVEDMSARRDSNMVAGYDRFEYKPKARNHKGKVLSWMTYWPWSLLWTLFNDFVRRVFNAIYNKIQKFLQKISDHAFRGTEKDF